MKGIFGSYVLWPFDKKLIFWIVTRVSARDYTVPRTKMKQTLDKNHPKNICITDPDLIIETQDKND